MSDLLITGARLSGSADAIDLRIVDGVIAEISPTDSTKSPRGDASVIDADNCLALPGFVDLHTHTREPGKPRAETADSASAAAAAGGYIAIHAMANTNPVCDSPELIQTTWQRGREIGTVDIRPIGAVTRGLAGNELAPIAAMHDTEAAPTVFSDDGHCVERADLMRAALMQVREFDGVIAQHAQEHTLTAGAQANEGEAARRMGFAGWPAVAESAIVARDVLLAADTGARLHVCHVSTAQTVEVLRWAKTRGIPVTAEVTPHHLVLTDEVVLSANPVFKVNPPLRAASDVQAVREAVADGTIDAVATDHAPHEDEHKSCAWVDAAMGMLGLETALAIVWRAMIETDLITVERLIQIMSSTPAQIGRIPAPAIAVGAPARLTLVDTHAQWTVDPATSHSLSRNTPFAEQLLSVRVVATVNNGRMTHTTERNTR